MSDFLPAEERAEVIRGYARSSRLTTFVETGSGDGDTCLALAADFDWLVTIELAYDKYLRSVERLFAYPRVRVLHGSSERVLATISPELRPALYWLDAHYCGGPGRGDKDCPLLEELSIIFSHGRPNVVLIDDARLLGEADGWPTLGELEANVYDWYRRTGQRYSFEVADDIVRLVPE